MDYTIRDIKEAEYPLLKDFLYEAIFVPEGVELPPRSIVNAPELQVYIENFGTLAHDKALVTEMDNKVIGAVWVRIMNDYGHIDNETPSFAISYYIFSEFLDDFLAAPEENGLIADSFTEFLKKNHFPEGARGTNVFTDKVHCLLTLRAKSEE